MESFSVLFQPSPASHTHLSIRLFLFLFIQSTKQQVKKAMDMRRIIMELTIDAQTATRKPWISKGDIAGEKQRLIIKRVAGHTRTFSINNKKKQNTTKQRISKEDHEAGRNDKARMLAYQE